MNATLKKTRLPLGIAFVLFTIAANFVQAADAFVLSVGVDSYQHVNQLQGCIADANNTVAAFNGQRGKMFTNVTSQMLVDSQATHANIVNQMRSISQRGRAGDYVIIFLSGHGARTSDNRSWYFLPVNYSNNQHAATALTDAQILNAIDPAAAQGKKVFVIVDACFAGQLGVSARNYLAKYRNPHAGGIVMMLSSRADQLSQALGSYSAFAKAFADGMKAGDGNRDGRVSLAEIQKYSYDRTYQLLRLKNNNAQQDSEMSWSPSFNGESTVALLHGNLNPTPAGPIASLPKPTPTKIPTPTPNTNTARVLDGSENLSGYGKLSFDLLPNGRAVMHDTQGATEGTWFQQGGRITLRFFNGRVTYRGLSQNGQINGTASNERSTWSWSAREVAVRY